MLKTEMCNELSKNIDRASTKEILEIIQSENINAAIAVGNAIDSIEKACDAISEGMKYGGHLYYIGAGTSGRLGVLDASECPPTFGVTPDTVVGIIAGGDKCLRSAAENAEDKGENGIKDISNFNINENDTVVGISVAGGASYVLEALKYAKKQGATTIGLTSNNDSPLAKESDICIFTDTGAEVITGSTRMKAGSAHKMVLNMLSTTAMIKMGYVYENYMINLKPTNIKLKDRTIRIVADITKLEYEKATELLENNEWNIKKALNAFNINIQEEN